MDKVTLAFLVCSLLGGFVCFCHYAHILLSRGYFAGSAALFRWRVASECRKRCWAFEWQGHHRACAHFKVNKHSVALQGKPMLALVPVVYVLDQYTDKLSVGTKEL